MEHIKFPSIEQFRTVIKNVVEHSSYIGRDVNNEPLFDYSKEKPTLNFIGTVKLHGTNASVCYNDVEGLWVQSRENIISLEKDNMACAFYVNQNKTAWLSIIDELVNEYKIDTSNYTVCIYFEWCGKGIQKGVAISELDKMSVIFASFKVSSFDENIPSIWYPTISNNKVCARPTNKIYNINSFKKYNIEIDFNEPLLSQNKIIELTLEVEDECPVGKDFGISGIGEGIVWEATYLDTRYTFKSKGEKHSNLKVKTLPKVDTESLNIIQHCVEEITHNWRFEQGLVEIFGIDYEQTISKTKLGEYLKWINADTLKEESDLISSFNLEPKDVIKLVQNKAKEYFNLVYNKGETN